VVIADRGRRDLIRRDVVTERGVRPADILARQLARDRRRIVYEKQNPANEPEMVTASSDLPQRCLTLRVTVPLQPAPAPPTAAGAPAPPIKFPLGWLLDHGAPPIQYRAIADVARLPGAASDPMSALPYGYLPAVRLALSQRADGEWGPSMLGLGKGDWFEGVGTINAVRRLLEYGWDRESPPLARVRRLLFRLLAEDEDPAYLFEFAGKPEEEDMARRGRAILREAAASALAQAGYELDPRLRGAARRIIERINAYLKTLPVAGMRPAWVRVGNRQVLPPEATPPSMYAIVMLAFMPQFRSEYHEHVERLYQFLTQPLPRQESAQLVGGTPILQPHLVLGDLLPHRNAVDADVPFALVWLEMLARLGFMRRNENWSRLFERFLDDRDRQGVWHPHKGQTSPKSGHPLAWPGYPLEESTAGDERSADVTFRLGLIARLTGRSIELI
jgi:hypothetical protein